MISMISTVNELVRDVIRGNTRIIMVSRVNELLSTV